MKAILGGHALAVTVTNNIKTIINNENIERREKDNTRTSKSESHYVDPNINYYLLQNGAF